MYIICNYYIILVDGLQIMSTPINNHTSPYSQPSRHVYAPLLLPYKVQAAMNDQDDHSTLQSSSLMSNLTNHIDRTDTNKRQSRLISNTYHTDTNLTTSRDQSTSFLESSSKYISKYTRQMH